MNLDLQLDQLESENLIHPTSKDGLEFIFKHALVQDAAYELLLKQDRRRLNRSVAEIIEELYADDLDARASRLAQHYAEAGDEDKTYEYAICAGDYAARLHAYHEARTHYAQALALLSPESATHDEKRRRVDATIKLVSVSLFADDLNLHRERLEQANHLLAGMDGAEDRLRHARIHYWLGRVHYFRNEMPQALRAFKDTLELAQDLGDADLLALPASVIGRALGLQGHWVQALPLLTKSIEPLHEAGRLYDSAVTIAFVGIVCAQQGEYREGLVEAQHALAHSIEIDHPTAISVSHVIVSFIRMVGNDFAGALEHARHAEQIARKMNDHAWVYVAHGLNAWTLGRMRKFVDAQKEFQNQEPYAQRLGGSLFLSDWFAAARAEIALAEGDEVRATELAQAAILHARKMGGVYAEGLAERVWGQALGKHASKCWDEAKAHLDTSLALFEKENAQLEAARTRLALGELFASHNLSLARGYWSQSAETFANAGLESDLAAAQSLLREAP